MIFVTRGIVVKDGCVLAARRPATMSLPLKWELPGGKLEPGEEPVTGLYRETTEELGLEIFAVEELPAFDRDFRGKHYRMLPFIAVVTGGELHLHEHDLAVWCPISELFTLDWAPSEEKILRDWIALTQKREQADAAVGTAI